MRGTSISHVIAWLRSLLLRWPWNVPPALRLAWWLLVVLLLVVAFLALQTILPQEHQLVSLPKWLTAALGVMLAWCIIPFINSIVGDAARYLLPMPANVQRRQEIRAKGVDLLNKLHQTEYQRIIVVGHSLGSVIGYDILTHAWPAYARQGDTTKPNPALDAIEQTIQQPEFEIEKFQAEQRTLARELRANGCGWLVTDFVTLGSPLTHAEILLAHDATKLRFKQDQKEFPTCPPVQDPDRISFPPDDSRRRLHHAALFGPTRWTNLYFPARFLLFGDLIGGPLRPLFGAGIRDYEVRTSQRAGIFSHTRYWTMGRKEPTEAHVQQLRDAVNLLDE